MRRIALYALSLISIIACSTVEQEKLRMDLPLESPSMPVYTQLLLKGAVSQVRQIVTIKTDNIEEIVSTEYVYGFDRNHCLVYYAVDGEETGMSSYYLTVPLFFYQNSYAFFLFPDIWWQTNAAVLTYRTKKGEKRFEFEWDDAGTFTKVRYYLDGEAVAIDGITDIETCLYDSNGYPRCEFYFKKSLDDSPGFDGEFIYSNFDEEGNPLKITMKGGNWNASVERAIEYYTPIP